MSHAQIKCIVLKTNSDELLLPNAAVAEIVPIRNIINVANKPSWMLGYLDWRGNSVPLVSFEAMGGARMPSLASGEIKAAMMFSISDDKDFPYMSILINGSPTIVNVNEADIVQNKEEIAHPAIENKIMLSKGNYSIMNLEKLENIIKSIMTAR